MHEVTQGTADRSYGIHVAKLAGLPPIVTTRATQILKTLESKGTPQKALKNLPLFDRKASTKPKRSQVEKMLSDIDPDSLSPRDALEKLYMLKKALSN